MGRIDIVYGFVLGALSLLFFVETLSAPASRGGINPRTFPLIVILSLFGLSVVLGIQGLLRSLRDRNPLPPTLPRGKTAGKLAVLTAAGAGYTLILEPVGYILATPVLIAVAMILFGERRPIRIAILSLTASAALYFLFRGVFRVPLPRSILW
ncbi:MAG TPA: tripartite tricarboxylate transporter TctB family protein [Spirochaetia bacterium]|nr:tripartite tricarboxylate transporter TctB family protein [Spirochaetales bacterium]HRZ89600.1 tripartite tricarboxylate transporter TctB family protein [Spirochaetia bacterium]